MSEDEESSIAEKIPIEVGIPLFIFFKSITAIHEHMQQIYQFRFRLYPTYYSICQRLTEKMQNL